MNKNTLLAALLAAALAAPATAGELNLYNWAEYFGESTIADYEAGTGTKVTLDYFDSNEVLETKMLAGGSGYDVVFPAASNAERQMMAGALHKIDVSRLENYANLRPEILGVLDKVPGGRELGVPYTWGTIGLAYNPALVADRLGDMPVDSWDLLFNPDFASKLKDCGIGVLDSPIEMISVTLNYLGLDPYSEDREDITKAQDVLAAAAPNVAYFNNQKPSSDLPSGNTCLAVMYSGDAGIAPRFSWRGSRNIGEMTMTWPAPEVFLSSGFRTIGYHDQLVLPIEITPEKPGRPIRIKGRMELGVCKDVCVPSELRFDHQLDAKASRNPAIAAALASRPYSATEAGVTAANCSLKPTQYGMQVEARITMPSAGGEELAVIEPGSPHLHAGETSTRRRGNLLVATTEFLPVQNGQMAAIDRSRLRITVLGQSHAVDITGCSAG